MSEGVQVRAAFRRDSKTEALWPGSEPTVPGAGHGLPLRTESISKRRLVATKGLIQGGPSQEAPTIVGWEAGGSTLFDLRYGNLDRIWAMALGFESPAADASGGSPHAYGIGNYSHLYESDQQLHNLATWAGTARHVRRGGLYINKAGTTHRLWPAMVEGFTLSISPDDASLGVDWVGYDYTRIGGLDATTWTPQSSYELNNGAKVTLPQTRVYLGVDPTLTEYFVRDLELTFRNLLKADDYRSGSLYIEEPMRAGMREVRVRATLVRYANNVLHDHHEADDLVSMLIDCNGGAIGATNARLAFAIPAARIASVSDPVSGPGLITQEFELVAHQFTTIPSAWTLSGPLANHTPAAVKPDLFIETQGSYNANVFEE